MLQIVTFIQISVHKRQVGANDAVAHQGAKQRGFACAIRASQQVKDRLVRHLANLRLSATTSRTR